MLQNCYWFPKHEWEARSSPYLQNQNIVLPSPEKITDGDLRYPTCEVFSKIFKTFTCNAITSLYA